jgi:hypothetical protein
MKLVFGGACLLVACVLMPVGWLSLLDPQVSEVEPKVDDNALRVAEIRIHGNVATRDRGILAELWIYPNKVLREEDLRQSERNLSWRFGWRFNWWEGRRPVVRVAKAEPPEAENRVYHDVEVWFPERDVPPWFNLLLDAGPFDFFDELCRLAAR